jgi:succinate dehydrogenase flavin-adding protein (antitoxin of CptAB toxin-antitoxin module)/predicted RNA-binding Zn-ribbon protein involved in translation (DUF1610 family)
MTCPINALTTKAQCDARYARALENPLQKEFSQCLSCEERKENVKKGICSCCGRHMIVSSMMIPEHGRQYLCATCKRGVEIGIAANYSYIEIKDEIAAHARSTTGGKNNFRYSFEGRFVTTEELKKLTEKSPAPTVDVTKQEQYKIVAEYQDNIIMKKNNMRIKKLQIILEERDQKIIDWIDKQAHQHRQDRNGYILNALEKLMLMDTEAA